MTEDEEDALFERIDAIRMRLFLAAQVAGRSRRLSDPTLASWINTHRFRVATAIRHGLRRPTVRSPIRARSDGRDVTPILDYLVNTGTLEGAVSLLEAADKAVGEASRARSREAQNKKAALSGELLRGLIPAMNEVRNGIAELVPHLYDERSGKLTAAGGGLWPLISAAVDLRGFIVGGSVRLEVHADTIETGSTIGPFVSKQRAEAIEKLLTEYIAKVSTFSYEQGKISKEAVGIFLSTAGGSMQVGPFRVIVIGAETPGIANKTLGTAGPDLERVRDAVTRMGQMFARSFPSIADRHRIPLIADYRGGGFWDETLPTDIPKNGGGAYYHGEFIVFYPRKWTSREDLITGLVHEFSHHVWRTMLATNARAAWIEHWSEREELNLEALIAIITKKWHNQPDLALSFGHALADVPRRLAIQTDIAGGAQGVAITEMRPKATLPGVGQGTLTLNKLRAAFAQHVRIPVPVHVSTPYGATNPEEGFCESLRLLIGWGPRGVLDEATVHLLRRLLEPHGFRRNRGTR